MKSIIVAFIFAFGLMIALPSTSLGSCSPPGQSSFVVGHFDIAPAIGFVQETVFVAEYNQLAPVTMMVQEKGGYTIEKSLNTSLVVGYSNKDVIVKAPDFTLLADYFLKTYLTCRSLESQNLQAKNTQSHDPVTIRADSKGSLI